MEKNNMPGEIWVDYADYPHRGIIAYDEDMPVNTVRYTRADLANKDSASEWLDVDEIKDDELFVMGLYNGSESGLNIKIVKYTWVGRHNEYGFVCQKGIPRVPPLKWKPIGFIPDMQSPNTAPVDNRVDRVDVKNRVHLAHLTDAYNGGQQK